MDVWLQTVASPRRSARAGAEAEEAGWDGLCVVDSQNLSGDAFVALAMAATSTERIGLATAVGNSVTRAAAVNASAAMSVDAISNGRMTLGIGRGDSALAHLGRAPGRVRHFETHLRHVQTYLRGEDVPFSEIDIAVDVAPPVDEMELAAGPGASRIVWAPSSRRKVPVEVAATGPRVIGIAATQAERVMFAVGADVERIAWGIDVARTAREQAGLDPDGVAFGAYVNAVCHPDLGTARDLIKGAVSIFARFSVMHGTTVGPVSDETEQSLQTLHDAYDMDTHSRNESQQAATLAPDFIDRFGIVGPPDRCIERFNELAALGLDKVVIAAQFQLGDTPEG
ncbi:MAG: LLM class flavin-dependent oxidoreductase, partial [Acidimicrobiales bacterium]